MPLIHGLLDQRYDLVPVILCFANGWQLRHSERWDFLSSCLADSFPECCNGCSDLLVGTLDVFALVCPKENLKVGPVAGYLDAYMLSCGSTSQISGWSPIGLHHQPIFQHCPLGSNQHNNFSNFGSEYDTNFCVMNTESIVCTPSSSIALFGWETRLKSCFTNTTQECSVANFCLTKKTVY